MRQLFCPLRPLICLPIEYAPRSGAWVLSGAFKDVRAVLSLNTVEDGFGSTGL